MDYTERSDNLKKKRLLSLLFSAVLVLSCCSFAVSAEKGTTKIKEVNVAQYKDFELTKKIAKASSVDLIHIEE